MPSRGDIVNMTKPGTLGGKEFLLIETLAAESRGVKAERAAVASAKAARRGDRGGAT